MSVAGASARDHMVPVAGRGGALVVWLYFATIAILAIWSLPDVSTPGPTLGALALFGATCVLATGERQERLSLSTTLITVAAWPVIALGVSWELLVIGGYAQWFVGAGTTSFFYLALRGRIAWAWIGFTALGLVVIVWGATTDAGLDTALGLVGRQVPILGVGTLFALGIRGTARRLARIDELESARATAAAAAAAAAVERRRRLVQLDEVATPLLEQLVTNQRLTDAERRQLAVTEAELRDSLRARSLTRPPLVAAVRAARERGVDVVLLDDSDPDRLDARDLDRVVDRAVAALGAALDEGDRVVIRLAPSGRSEAATILVETAHDAHRETVASSRSADAASVAASGSDAGR